MIAPACFELGCVLKNLPEHYRDHGLIYQVMLAYRYGYANQLWNRQEASSLAFRANFQAYEGQGKGSRAAKRAARQETERWFDENQLTDTDIDAIANDHLENSRQPKLNYHCL